MRGKIEILAKKEDLGNISQLNVGSTTNLVDAANALNTNKLDKDFSGLSEKITPATGDILPIESNGTTYKIDYNALAAAILDGAVTKQLSTISDCNDNTLQVSDEMIHYYRTNSNTANTPYKQGITKSTEGVLFVFGNQDYTTQIHYCVSEMRTYIRSKSGTGSVWNNKAWTASVTGIKGSEESNYRTGNVNLTAANVGAVAKSGDTMTGTLTIKSTSLDNLVNPSSDQYMDSLVITDKNSKRMGIIRQWRHPNGTNSLVIGALHESSSAKFNLLTLTIDSAGNATYQVENPANFRSAINAVSKSGDTMTGSLKINSSIFQTEGYIFGSDDGYSNHGIKLGHANDNVMHFYEYGGVFTFYKSVNNVNTPLLQIKDGVSGAPLRVDNGGTGATTAANARENLEIAGEEIPLLSNPLAINNDATGLQYTANSNNNFAAYKFVDLYFVVQGGYTNAIRLCPEYGEKTYKFGFFAWHLDDNVIRKVAVAFTTAGRYFTNCVVRIAYGDNGAFSAADNGLYLYKAIGYKW